MNDPLLIRCRPYPHSQRRGRYALCTMCIGVDPGIALISERLQAQ